MSKEFFPNKFPCVKLKGGEKRKKKGGKKEKEGKGVYPFNHSRSLPPSQGGANTNRGGGGKGGKEKKRRPSPDQAGCNAFALKCSNSYCEATEMNEERKKKKKGGRRE